MRSNAQETKRSGAQYIISVAQGRREAYLDSALKASSAAWTGPAVLALLFLACLAYLVIDDIEGARSTANANIATAAIAPTASAAAGAARLDQTAGAASGLQVSAAAVAVGPSGDNDGNVMTYEHD